MQPVGIAISMMESESARLAAKPVADTAETQSHPSGRNTNATAKMPKVKKKMRIRISGREKDLAEQQHGVRIKAA